MSGTQDRDVAHHLRGFMRLSDKATQPPLVLDHGKGVYVFDESGREYLEAAAGMWCVALGFGEEELVEAAQAQMRRLPYYHTLLNRTTGPAAELAAEIAAMVPMRDAQVHFTVSGSEANDYAVKFLRYRNNALGRPAKKRVVARQGGYHGATLVATSLTGLPRYHQLFDAPLPGFLHTADPHYYRNGRPGETAEEFSARLAEELEALIVAAGPETVAAFVAEPVTGGGGVVVPPAGYYDAVQEVLGRYDVAFLSDEIITGFGRTGNDFGAQTCGIRPDLMTVGKSLSSGYLPIAALVVSGDVYDGLEAGSDEVGTFAHGATHSGHPVAAAVALRTLQLMRERDVLGHVRRVSVRFAERLARVADHPLVGEVRSCGLMGGVELVADRETRRMFDPPGAVSAQVAARCADHGLLVRTAAVHDVVTFSPPLVITEAEIDELFDRFELALADVRIEA